MAYVLGFFAADGYMTVNKGGGHYINIQIIDKPLIQMIRTTIGSEHKISQRKPTANQNILYRLQIGSKDIFEDLEKLGMRPNKTNIMVIPNIPNKYLNHFVRGYFDGDGHVWVGEVHKDRKTSSFAIQTVFTSCSVKFLEQLRLKLEHCGVGNGRIRLQKGNYFRLVYSIKSSLKLYNFMYNELGKSKLFLPRKKVRFEKYI